MQAWFLKQWQTFGLAQLVLIPISWVFQFLSSLRRSLYDFGLLKSYSLSVPVIVVGNINVGGTGKTPMVIYLVEQLKNAGYMPGVISRGYGGNQSGEVNADSHPTHFGDEPVLIAKRTLCPVYVNADRVLAGQQLLSNYPNCDVIVSDDGLQHYRLKRDVEMIIVNAPTSLGNQKLLPSGPLREPLKRLCKVNFIIDTGRFDLANITQLKQLPPIYKMQLQMNGIYSLDDTLKTNLQALHRQTVVAIAGIGHPERFFNFIKGLGLQCEFHAFDDHHAFQQSDFEAFKNKTLLMTEKDAVKCKHLALDNAWYLPVSAMVTSEKTLKPLEKNIIDLLNAN
jgi:tetraacyldisaccharide 4'-kinase